MNAGKLFAALRWLDYQPAVINIILGVTTGLMLSELLFQASPPIAGVGFVALLGGAVALAGSGEPIAVPVKPEKAAPPPPPVEPKPKPEPSPLVELVEIPAGVFSMGSDGYDDEEPIHEVRISAFRCMKFPVTRRLYQDVMGNNPSLPKDAPDNRPVSLVSWYDTIEFCNRLSEREGLIPAYHRHHDSVSWDATANGYRLLTEAEWEYVCRAGTQTRYSFGDGERDLGEYAWYSKNSGGITHPVGGRKPNPWGLYDMHGNVLEWCWDWYGSYPSEPQGDPLGPPAGNIRVMRGGSMLDVALFLRSAYRGGYAPGDRYQIVGFRCARGPRRQPSWV